MILTFHYWSIVSMLGPASFESDGTKYILDQINKVSDVSQVNILNPEEVYMSTDEIVNLCQARNIKLTFLFGASSLPYYIKNKLHSPKDNRYVKIWPTFFFNFTAFGILTSYQENNYTYKTKNEFKYSIISMNGRRSLHRCILMDQLAKHNLIENNAISWCDQDVNGTAGSYTWKYWKNPKILELTNVCNEKSFTPSYNFNQFIVPLEYSSAFLHLVPETTPNIPFITEKTVLALLHGKLFIASGAQFFYKELKRLGFLTYDEIIDYSFDQVEDCAIRQEMIVDQIVNLTRDPSKFNDIYKLIEPKIKFNQTKALNFACNRIYYDSMSKLYTDLLNVSNNRNNLSQLKNRLDIK